MEQMVGPGTLQPYPKPGDYFLPFCTSRVDDFLGCAMSCLFTKAIIDVCLCRIITARYRYKTMGLIVGLTCISNKNWIFVCLKTSRDSMCCIGILDCGVRLYVQSQVRQDALFVRTSLCQWSRNHVPTEELRKIGNYITKCHSAKIIDTWLRSGGMRTAMSDFTRLRHFLVLEGTVIVSMTLNVEKREEKISCLDERLGAFEEVLPPLWLGSLLVPINDGLVRDAVIVV